MDQLKSIIETAWGLEIVLIDNFIIDDNSIIPTIKLIMMKCKEANRNKVLVDASKVIRQVSIFKLLEVSEVIQKEFPRFKVAFIPPNSADIKQSNSMETFSFNRGISLQYFRDKETALEWLLQ